MHTRILEHISDIDETAWQTLWQSHYPFIQYGFLAALEQTHCVGENTGWQPLYIIAEQDGALLGAMPLYLKNHSYGEYVFDWSWADAYHHHGLDYYPKLINAIPFTPATGPRFAACNDEASAALFSACLQLAESLGASGWHCLFPDMKGASVLSANPKLTQRLGTQFHWFNQHYKDFDDFLSTFTSRKRKTIKKEREKANTHVQLVRKRGSELTHEDWQHFFRLYQRTYLKRSGRPGYLTEAFFTQLGKVLCDQVLMVQAISNEQCIAAALYFYDDTTLYGRYWGAIAEFDGLHFECCYYQGIEFAIENSLQRFDPGAQGEHKIPRGFIPVLTQSFHILIEPNFHYAICDFTAKEGTAVREYCLDARNALPFNQAYTLDISPDILLEETP